MALSPALARARRESLVPDTVAIFSFRQPSVVMGYYISPDEDVDLGFCRENGIVVKRVPTQGLIFGHAGYIMTALYIHRQHLPDEMPAIFQKTNEGIARAMEKAWSIPARHRPLNDLEIQIQGKWKKIGPHSLAFDGDIAVDRIGLTVTPIPMQLAEKAIVPPPEKFADKEAKSVSERVGSLEEGLGREVSLAEAKELVIRALEETFQVRLTVDALTKAEREFYGQFCRMYDNDEWFFQKSAKKRFSNVPAGAQLSRFVHKVSGGPMIRVNLCVHEGRIQEILFTGNMQPARRETPEQLEQALRQARATESEIVRVLRREWEEREMEIAGARAEDFIAATMGAVGKLTP
jgi:lipoate-protein ligase A